MAIIGNPIVSTDFPVDYFSGNNSTTAFTLSIAPASVNALDVQVGGVPQSPQTYTVSGTTLTFSTAPPTGSSNIIVRHKGIAGIPNVPADASVTTAKLAALTTLPVSGGYTATLPSATGTVMVNGNMPAASVYMANTMNGVSTDVFTKVQFDTKVFDTATCFNNTGSTATLNGLSVPSYSFCPNVAGYYQVTMNMDNYGATSGLNITQQIFKNGVRHTYNYIYSSALSSGGYEFPQTLGCLVYLNGTGDYINGYLQFNNGSSIQIYGGQSVTRFDVICVRTA